RRHFCGSHVMTDHTNAGGKPANVPAARQVEYLRRRQAAEYLRARGIPRTEKTLAKLASIGGGPMYRCFGRIPLYTVEDLDAYAGITVVTIRNYDRYQHPVAKKGAVTDAAATQPRRKEEEKDNPNQEKKDDVVVERAPASPCDPNATAGGSPCDPNATDAGSQR